MLRYEVTTGGAMFTELEKLHSRPRPFEFYTAAELWTDPHISRRMLEFHLNETVDISSRNARFIDRSVEWICNHFSVGRHTRIADFGCGPGLYTTRLAGHQAHVLGIDFSARSIDHARQVAAEKGLAIDYVNQNYLEFETGARFDLILMIMCDYCALSPAQRRRLLTSFHALLEPGGCVLLDVYSLRAFARRAETVTFEPNLLDGFWSPDIYYGFLNTFKYEDEKVVLDQYTIIEADRTRTIYNWLQYFSPEQLAKEFAQAGLGLDGTFADVAGSPFAPDADEFAVVARKP
jgi:SAM-dependent methyltransferase